jgi:hypothetical protein
MDSQDTPVYDFGNSSYDETSDEPAIIGGPADRDSVTFSRLPVELLENNLMLVTDVRCLRAAVQLFRPQEPLENLDGLVITHMRDLRNLFCPLHYTCTYPVIVYCGNAPSGIDQTVLQCCLKALEK